MKITRRQLRRLIREVGRSEHDAEARGMAASYQRGYSDGWSTPQSPPTTGRDPEYLRGYEKGVADAEDASGEAKYIREAEGSTKKYDDDSALKGGQSKLPDGLQKGIIDKTVEDREERKEEEREEKNEARRLVRQVLREAANDDDFVKALRRTWDAVRIDVGIRNPTSEDKADEAVAMLGTYVPELADQFNALPFKDQDMLLRLAFDDQNFYGKMY
jgi:hypothetical protein